MRTKNVLNLLNLDYPFNIYYLKKPIYKSCRKLLTHLHQSLTHLYQWVNMQVFVYFSLKNRTWTYLYTFPRRIELGLCIEKLRNYIKFKQVVKTMSAAFLINSVRWIKCQPSCLPDCSSEYIDIDWVSFHPRSWILIFHTVRRAQLHIAE